MSPTTERPQSPFLDMSSMAAQEPETVDEPGAPTSTSYESESPFRSIYELAGQEDVTDPEAEAFAALLAELHNQESEEVLFELVNEAADLYENRFEGEYGGLTTQTMDAEQMLEEHFAPLVRELETLLETISEDVESLTLNSMSEAEIDAFIDQYEFSRQLSPSFENFGGWLKKKLKKGLKWAKKRAKALAARAFRAALKRLKRYMKPWLKKIVRFAINKLPRKYRPLARLLARRLGIRKELESGETFETDDDSLGITAEFESEFDLFFANLLFESDEERQEHMLAEVLTEAQQPVADPFGDYDRARRQFIHGIRQLDEDGDPAELVENFIPAILPLVKLGIKFYGRDKLIRFLAKFVARLIKRFIPRKYRTPLSRAIVDAGLRLIHLEATPEDEDHVALEAIADIVEETVRRVAESPDYMLEDEALFEASVLDAFESAARSTLPPILPEKVYRERPELRETHEINGTWVRQPLRGRKSYEKFTRVFDCHITPHMARVIKTWRGRSLATILQDCYGMPRGQVIRARVHLYKAVPGTWLSRISKHEKHVAGLGTSGKLAWSKILPLTPQAAAMILGEAGLGRGRSEYDLADPLMIDAGQRFYYLEIQDAPARMLSVPGGAMVMPRCCQTHVTLDFPQDQICVFMFLSESEAQSLATKLRQRMPMGPIMTALQPGFTSGLSTAFSEGMSHQVKLIHGAMAAVPSARALLKWLPPVVQEMLVAKLTEWVGSGLNQYLQQRAADVVTSAEDPAQGLTMVMRLNNPPGLATIRRILDGEPVVLRGLKFPDGMPETHVRTVPGYWYG